MRFFNLNAFYIGIFLGLVSLAVADGFYSKIEITVPTLKAQEEAPQKIPDLRELFHSSQYLGNDANNISLSIRELGN